MPPTSLPFLVTDAVAWTPSTGPHDMIYQPCLLLHAILPPLSLSLSGASSPRSSIGDARLASLSDCPTHAMLRSGTTKCVWCVCDRIPCRPIRREGNGSRERRLMRSRVSLAELFHEIRVSIYESRSRRFLSLEIGRTFIILRERIRIEVENKKASLRDISHLHRTPRTNRIVELTSEKTAQSSLLNLKLII